MAACNSNVYKGRLIPGHTHEDIDEVFAEVPPVRFVHNSSHWMAACNSNAYQGRLIPGHTHEDTDEAFAEVPP